MNARWLTTFAAILVSTAPAWTQDGGQVVSGGATITNPNATTTRIDQSTDRVIINWNNFSVASGNTVLFNQPSSSSIALNRVIGQDPSTILGSIQANGGVWVLNPNGILFGAGSTINVGGFLASTLSLSNDDFLSENYRLTQDPAFPLSYVVNQGAISAQSYAALIAPLVENSGSITAPGGTIFLLGTGEALFKLDSRGLVAGSIGSVAGGTVLIRSEALSDVVRAVVNTTGLVEAGSVVTNADGTISLVGAGGTAVNSGTLSTEGIDGGSILLNSSLATALASTSRLLSDAGLIEFSTKGDFTIGGVFDTLSPSGAMGEILIDPFNITIVAGPAQAVPPPGFGGSGTDGAPLVSTAAGATINDGTIEALLGIATVRIQTGAGGAQPGDIFINAEINAPANGSSLILQAHHDILINADINFTASSGSVSLQADANVGFGLVFDGDGVDADDGGRILRSGGATIRMGTGDLQLIATFGIGTPALPILTTGVTDLSALNHGYAYIPFPANPFPPNGEVGIFIVNTGSDLNLTNVLVSPFVGTTTGVDTWAGDALIQNTGNITISSGSGINPAMTWFQLAPPLDPPFFGRGIMTLTSTAGSIFVNAPLTSSAMTHVADEPLTTQLMSGSFVLNAPAGDIIGNAAGQIVTGATSVNGANGGDDQAFSGNITLIAGGEVRFANPNALVTGNTSVNGTDGINDFAIPGGISIDAARVTSDGGTGRLGITLGSSLVNGAPSGFVAALDVDTFGPAGDAGGIFLQITGNVQFFPLTTLNGNVDVLALGGDVFVSLVNAGTGTFELVANDFAGGGFGNVTLFDNITASSTTVFAAGQLGLSTLAINGGPVSLTGRSIFIGSLTSDSDVSATATSGDFTGFVQLTGVNVADSWTVAVNESPTNAQTGSNNVSVTGNVISTVGNINLFAADSINIQGGGPGTANITSAGNIRLQSSFGDTDGIGLINQLSGGAGSTITAAGGIGDLVVISERGITLGVNAGTFVDVGRLNALNVSTGTGATAAGAIAVVNTGALELADLTGSGFAVRNQGTGTVLISTGDNLTVSAPVTAAASTPQFGALRLVARNLDAFLINNSSITTPNGGGIDLVADRMDLDGGLVTARSSSPLGVLRVLPSTPAHPIDLGSALDPTGILSLSQAELNTLSTVFLFIGSPGATGSGPLTISAPLVINPTVPVTSFTEQFNLDTGTGFDITQTAPITVPFFSFRSGGSVFLTNAANNIGGLSGTAVGQIEFTNSDGMGVTAFNSTNGIQAGGDVTLRTVDGDLGIGANGISAAGFTVTLTAGGIGAILDQNGGLTNIVADSAVLIANRGIGSLDALEVDVNTLQALNVGAGATGGIQIFDLAGGLTLNDINAVSTSAVQNDGGGIINIGATGFLTVNAPVYGNNDLTLSAGESGAPGENLTINSEVVTFGSNLFLSAGDTIVLNMSANPGIFADFLFSNFRIEMRAAFNDLGDGGAINQVSGTFLTSDVLALAQSGISLGQGSSSFDAVRLQAGNSGLGATGSIIVSDFGGLEIVNLDDPAMSGLTNSALTGGAINVATTGLMTITSSIFAVNSINLNGTVINDSACIMTINGTITLNGTNYPGGVNPTVNLLPGHCFIVLGPADFIQIACDNDPNTNLTLTVGGDLVVFGRIVLLSEGDIDLAGNTLTSFTGIVALADWEMCDPDGIGGIFSNGGVLRSNEFSLSAATGMNLSTQSLDPLAPALFQIRNAVPTGLTQNGSDVIITHQGNAAFSSIGVAFDPGVEAVVQDNAGTLSFQTTGNLTIQNGPSNPDVFVRGNLLLGTLGVDGMLTNEGQIVSAVVPVLTNNIILRSDRMNLTGSAFSSITLPDNRFITLQATSAGRLINLGSLTDIAPNTLELSDAELDTILPANPIPNNNNFRLFIGSTSIGGAITISSAISLQNSGPVGALLLDTTSTITQTAPLTVPNHFTIRAGGAVTLDHAGNNVLQLTSTTGGPLIYRDANDVSIGNFFGTGGFGIFSNNNNVTITAVNGPIQFGTGAPFFFGGASINAGTGLVRLTSTGAAGQILDRNGGIDIFANQAILVSGGGIGNGNQLEIQVNELQAINSGIGGRAIDIRDFSGGLVLRAIDASVSPRAASNSAAGFSMINVWTDGGTLTVSDPVVADPGFGWVWLISFESGGVNDIVLNADVMAPSLTVAFWAGDSIIVGPGGVTNPTITGLNVDFHAGFGDTDNIGLISQQGGTISGTFARMLSENGISLGVAGTLNLLNLDVRNVGLDGFGNVAGQVPTGNVVVVNQGDLAIARYTGTLSFPPFGVSALNAATGPSQGTLSISTTGTLTVNGPVFAARNVSLTGTSIVVNQPIHSAAGPITLTGPLTDNTGGNIQVYLPGAAYIVVVADSDDNSQQTYVHTAGDLVQGGIVIVSEGGISIPDDLTFRSTGGIVLVADWDLNDFGRIAPIHVGAISAGGSLLQSDLIMATAAQGIDLVTESIGSSTSFQLVNTTSGNVVVEHDGNAVIADLDRAVNSPAAGLTTAGAGVIDFVASGSITLNADVVGSASGAVTLEAGTSIIDDGVQTTAITTNALLTLIAGGSIGEGSADVLANYIDVELVGVNARLSAQSGGNLHVQEVLGSLSTSQLLTFTSTGALQSVALSSLTGAVNFDTSFFAADDFLRVTAGDDILFTGGVTVTSGQRMTLVAGGDILQSGIGLVTAPQLVLSAVGEILLDRTQTSQLQILAGTNVNLTNLGDLTLLSLVGGPAATATGDLEVRTVGDLSVLGAVNGGSIDLFATSDLTVTPVGPLNATTDVTLQAGAGTLSISASSTAVPAVQAGGNVTLIAGGDVRVIDSNLLALPAPTISATGSLTVTAGAGIVLEGNFVAGDLNASAVGNLNLEGTVVTNLGSIGLSAGGLVTADADLDSATTLTILGDLGVTLNDSSGGDITATGAILIASSAGSVSVFQNVSGPSLQIDAPNGSILVDGVLTLGAGGLDLFAGIDVKLGNNVTSTGPADATAGGNLIVAGIISATDIDFSAGGDLTVLLGGQLSATAGDLALQSGGTLSVTGNSASSAILAASAGGIDLDGVVVLVTDQNLDPTIHSIVAFDELRVNATGNASLVGTFFGNGVVVTAQGNLTVNGLVTGTTADLTAGGTLTVGATVNVATGASFEGDAGVTLGGTVTVTTGAFSVNSSNGPVSVLQNVTADSIGVDAAGAVLVNGNLTADASGGISVIGGGNVTLNGNLSAASGPATATAGGTLTISGNVTALSITLGAPTGTIIANGDLDATAGNLLISASGNVTVNGLADATGQLTISSINGNTTMAGTGNGGTVTLSSGSGGTLLVTGNLTSTTALLQLTGGQVIVDSTLSAASALIIDSFGNAVIDGTLSGAGGVDISANGTVTGDVDITTTAGPILISGTLGVSLSGLSGGDLVAVGGPVILSSSAGGVTVLQSITGTFIDVQASGGDVSLRSLTSTTGSVTVTGNANVSLNGGANSASDLSIQAGGSLQFGGGVFVAAGDVNGDGFGDIIGTGSIQAGGQVSLTSSTGTLTLTSASGGTGIVLTAAGNVNASGLLNAGGGDVSVTSNGGNVTLVAVTSSGATTINASGRILLTGAITANSLLLSSTTGSIGSNGIVTVLSGGATLTAADDVTLTGLMDLSAGTQTLTVTAGGSIEDGTAGILASSIALSAGAGIGTAGNPLNISAGVFAAAGGSEGVFVFTSGSPPSIGTVGSVDGVSATGGTISITWTGSAGAVINRPILHSGGGNIILTATGDIIQNANISTSGNGGVWKTTDGGLVMAPSVSTTSGSGGITIDASGDVILGLLSSGGSITIDVVGGGLTIDQPITVTGIGNIMLDVSGDIVQNANIVGSSNGGVWKTTDGGLIMDPTASTTSGLGGITIDASGDVSLALLSTSGTVTLSSSTGSILDINDVAGDALNIQAGSANLSAAGSLGTPTNCLELQIGTTLVYAAGGSINLCGTVAGEPIVIDPGAGGGGSITTLLDPSFLAGLRSSAIDLLTTPRAFANILQFPLLDTGIWTPVPIEDDREKKKKLQK